MLCKQHAELMQSQAPQDTDNQTPQCVTKHATALECVVCRVGVTDQGICHIHMTDVYVGCVYCVCLSALQLVIYLLPTYEKCQCQDEQCTRHGLIRAYAVVEATTGNSLWCGISLAEKAQLFLVHLTKQKAK